MEHVIFVFSATGNTLHIAKLVEKFSEEKVIINPINEKDYGDQNADIVGIYFPCFYGSMPHLVEQFISKLNVNHKTYIYSVVTAGGNTGNCNKELSKALAKNGLRLSFGADIVYASNYMPGWYYRTAVNNIKLKLSVFENEAKKIVQRILNREVNPIKGSYIGSRIPKIISPAYLVRDTRPCDKEFTIGTQCDKCGLCVKVCPVGNIEIEDNQHVFKHNCQRCMSCIQYCPKQAFVVKGKTMNKERYVNPFLTVKDIIDLR